MRESDEEHVEMHRERWSIVSALALAVCVAAVACGAPGPREARRADTPSADRLTWEPVPPGEYLVYDATLQLAGPEPSSVHLPGEWRARFLAPDARRRRRRGRLR